MDKEQLDLVQSMVGQDATDNIQSQIAKGVVDGLNKSGIIATISTTINDAMSKGKQSEPMEGKPLEDDGVSPSTKSWLAYKANNPFKGKEI